MKKSYWIAIIILAIALIIGRAIAPVVYYQYYMHQVDKAVDDYNKEVEDAVNDYQDSVDKAIEEYEKSIEDYLNDEE